MRLHPALPEPGQRITSLALVVHYVPNVPQRYAWLVHEVADSRKAVDLRSLRLLCMVELEGRLFLRDELLLRRSRLERAFLCLEGRLNRWTAESLLELVRCHVGSGRHQLFILGLQHCLLVGDVPAESLFIV